MPGVALATEGSLEERLTSWINTAAFTAAPAYTLGKRTEDTLRTAHTASATSTSASRRCRGWATISVRADVMNLFDNPLFTTLQSQFGTPTFGQLTAVGGYARSVQFQVRFGFSLCLCVSVAV